MAIGSFTRIGGEWVIEDARVGSRRYASGVANWLYHLWRWVHCVAGVKLGKNGENRCRFCRQEGMWAVIMETRWRCMW